MTKALLSNRGIEFDALDVANDPAAMTALQALGITSVPAVVVGERWMTGWNPTRLAALVGFAYTEHAAPPQELVGSIGQIVESAIRAVCQVPDSAWDSVWPGRDRPLRELARHLFEVVERGVDADVMSAFPADVWLRNHDAPGLASAALMQRYGRAAQAKFAAWYVAPLDTAAFGRSIEADVGPRTLTQVLERTRLHAGQHLRQIYALLEKAGVQPDAPLTDADLRRLGLDLPTAVF
jgi:hypothetical protein